MTACKAVAKYTEKAVARLRLEYSFYQVLLVTCRGMGTPLFLDLFQEPSFLHVFQEVEAVLYKCF